MNDIIKGVIPHQRRATKRKVMIQNSLVAARPSQNSRNQNAVAASLGDIRAERMRTHSPPRASYESHDASGRSHALPAATCGGEPSQNLPEPRHHNLPQPAGTGPEPAPTPAPPLTAEDPKHLAVKENMFLPLLQSGLAKLRLCIPWRLCFVLLLQALCVFLRASFET